MRFTDTQNYNLFEEDGNLVGTGKMSFFGGSNDPMDSGSTASGFSTKEHPDMPYVALPGPVRRKYKMPWGCRVTVEGPDGEQVRGFLADTGPAAQTGRQIDLSPIFNVELGIQTDDIVRFYVDIHTIDPRWSDATGA